MVLPRMRGLQNHSIDQQKMFVDQKIILEALCSRQKGLEFAMHIAGLEGVSTKEPVTANPRSHWC